MELEMEICCMDETSHLLNCSFIQSVPFKNFINQFFLAMQLNQETGNKLQEADKSTRFFLFKKK